MRSFLRRSAPSRALTVTGALILLAGLGSAPAAAASTDAGSSEVGRTDPATVGTPGEEVLVPADEGGLYRSTITPMVPPGCDSVTVELPLVEGVTWWVQSQDMLWVADPGQQLDPRSTTVLTAVLTPDRVFEDGQTSARWVVAPTGGDITTGCTATGAPAAAPAGPATVEPAPVAPAPATPEPVTPEPVAPEALQPAAVPVPPAGPARAAAAVAASRTPVPASAGAPAAPLAAIPAAPAARADREPTAGEPARPAVLDAVAAQHASDAPVAPVGADAGPARGPAGDGRTGSVRSVALISTSAVAPVGGSAVLGVTLLLALAGCGAATAAARRRRTPAEGTARR